ncbi:unnamed protein product [Trichobilharzia szidati]|nr:unnamed protein product [Trichobilharzia szidati]
MMKGSQITNHRKFPVDGCLPDIDYSAMRMKNLDDQDLDRVLMEYECVQVQRGDTNSSSEFNITLTSSNEKIVGKDKYEEVFIETVNDEYGVKSGDQVVQIDGVSVRNLKQAKQLLERCGNSVSLLLLRPIRISNLGCENASCNGSTDKNDTSSQFIQPPRLFPHMVYTTPDRLTQTIWLQQNIFREKLNVLSKINGVIKDDTNVAGVNPISNINTKKDTQTNETENRYETRLPRYSNSETDKNNLTSWTIRRSADGTRYITKKYKRSSELPTCRTTRMNDNNRYQSDKSLSISHTNSSSSDISEYHPASKPHSKSISHLENKSSHILQWSHTDNNPSENQLRTKRKESIKYPEYKLQKTGILKNTTDNLYTQSNIPTSILMKPPILFRRSHSANVSRNTSVHFDLDKKHTSFLGNQSQYHKQNHKLKSSSNYKSVSVVTM